MKTLLVSCLLIVILALTLVDLTSYDMNTINDFLKKQVENDQTPSIQYAFFDGAGIIYAKGFGLKNIKASQGIDDATTFNLYSVTKTFTALAVLQLAQAGKIELDKPVSSYLPEFPYDKSITVEQLLSHTSGIPNPIPLKWIHLVDEHADFDRNLFFSDVFKSYPTLDFQPGTDFKYTNLGYVFLGQLIERTSGQIFEEYVTINIVERIGIGRHDLGFDIEPVRHAVGYHKWWSFSNALFGFLIDKGKFMGPREGKWKPFNSFYNNGTAYGGMIGSERGLIRYAQALLMNESVLLDNKYKEFLFSEWKINNRSTGMSFSWFTDMLKGHRYFAHAGGGGGYYVELRVYPDLGVGSVIMYNRSGMKDERMLNRADGFFITEKANN